MGYKYEDFNPRCRAEIMRQLASKTLAARPQAAIAQPPLRDESLGQGEVQKRSSKRIDVRFHQFTRRRCDPDNVVCKFCVDWLRYKGFIPDDTDDDITVTVRQIQVATKEEEGVLIEIL